MKNRLYYFMICLFVVTLTVSCGDWLDVKPKTQLDREEAFSQEMGYKDALVGCYIKLKSRSSYGEKLTMKTTEYLAQNWAKKGDGSIESSLMDFKYDATSVSDNFKAIYTNLYNILVQVNDILSYIDKNKNVFNSVVTFNVIKGEALALRGFIHFDILRLFGQVPGGTIKVSLPFLDKVSIETPKYLDYDSYVARIEADLDEAQTLLKESDPIMSYNIIKLNSPYWLEPKLDDDFLAFRRFRLNYYAVKAIQARFYLYTNVPAKANEAAMIVINAKDKDNMPQFIFNAPESFKKFNYALPDETIFCLNDINLLDFVDLNFKTQVSVSQNKDRIIEIFEGEHSVNNRYRGFWKDQTVNFDQYFTICKYDQLETDVTSDQTTERQLIPIVRLSEMYLIAMETMDYIAAQPLYDIYRADRNLQPRILLDNDYKNQEVIKEYRREFIGEGQMFFVYKRLNATEMLWRSSPIIESNYIVPLPDSEYNPNN